MSTDRAADALQYLRDVVAGTVTGEVLRVQAAKQLISKPDVDDPEALAYLSAAVAGDEPATAPRIQAARALAPGTTAEPPPTQQTEAFLSYGTGKVLGVIEGENPGPIALLTYVYDGEGDESDALDLEPLPHGMTLDGSEDSLAGTTRTGYTMTEKRNEHVGPAALHAGQGYAVHERPPLVLPAD